MNLLDGKDEQLDQVSDSELLVSRQQMQEEMLRASFLLPL